jgi:iron complex transport system substrate-binding protein
MVQQDLIKRLQNSTQLIHYSQFDAFKSKQVYTFEGKIGATGGTIYYESASRPDLVPGFIKIFHPELLPNYTFTFAQN